MRIYFEIHLTDYYRIKSRQKNETHHIDDNTFSAHINASTQITKNKTQFVREATFFFILIIKEQN